MSVGNLEMDMTLKMKFPGLWGRNFDNAELPIIYYYTDEENRADGVSPPSAHQCMIGVLARVRKGKSLLRPIRSAAPGQGIYGLQPRDQPDVLCPERNADLCRADEEVHPHDWQHGGKLPHNTNVAQGKKENGLMGRRWHGCTRCARGGWVYPGIYVNVT